MPPTIALKRGKNNPMEIFAWHQSVVAGQLAAVRKSATLVMYAAGLATPKGPHSGPFSLLGDIAMSFGASAD